MYQCHAVYLAGLGSDLQIWKQEQSMFLFPPKPSKMLQILFQLRAEPVLNYFNNRECRRKP